MQLTSLLRLIGAIAQWPDIEVIRSASVYRTEGKILLFDVGVTRDILFELIKILNYIAAQLIYLNADFALGILITKHVFSKLVCLLLSTAYSQFNKVALLRVEVRLFTTEMTERKSPDILNVFEHLL